MISKLLLWIIEEFTYKYSALTQSSKSISSKLLLYLIKYFYSVK